MAFLVCDETSVRAYASAETSLYYYDGAEPSGSQVATLPRQLSHIQREFGEDQIVISCWNVGLMCYQVATGEVSWMHKDLPRVAGIAYSAASRKYLVQGEDEFGCISYNRSGERLEEWSDIQVLGTFDRGRYLLAVDARGSWRVASSTTGAIVIKTRARLKQPVLSVTGTRCMVAFAPRGGGIEVYDLRSGKCMVKIERQNWFNVPSLVRMKDPLKFRALVSDWDDKPVGAVIEIDVKKKACSLVQASGEWNWDAKLLNYGEAVLRFHESAPSRFTLTHL